MRLGVAPVAAMSPAVYELTAMTASARDAAKAASLGLSGISLAWK